MLFIWADFAIMRTLRGRNFSAGPELALKRGVLPLNVSGASAVLPRLTDDLPVAV
jgi:hypothetical protein